MQLQANHCWMARWWNSLILSLLLSSLLCSFHICYTLFVSTCLYSSLLCSLLLFSYLLFLLFSYMSTSFWICPMVIWCNDDDLIFLHHGQQLPFGSSHCWLPPSQLFINNLHVLARAMFLLPQPHEVSGPSHLWLPQFAPPGNVVIIFF